MTTTRFDQEPGSYGRCLDCTKTFEDSLSMYLHQDMTLKNSATNHSHSCSIINRTRPERIKSHIEETIGENLREHGDLFGRELEMNETVIEESVRDICRDMGLNKDYTAGEVLLALDSLKEPEIAKTIAKVLEISL